MYVGTQYFGTSKIEMEFLSRHGVTHFDATVDGMDADTLARHREEAAAYGVELEMIHVPPMDSIPMAKDPQRDQRHRPVLSIHRKRAQSRTARFELQLLRLARPLGRPRTAHRTQTGPRRNNVQLFCPRRIRQRHPHRNRPREPRRGF